MYRPCENVIKHPYCPLNLITGCTTFIRNKCNETRIILYQSFTSLWRLFLLNNFSIGFSRRN